MEAFAKLIETGAAQVTLDRPTCVCAPLAGSLAVCRAWYYSCILTRSLAAQPPPILPMASTSLGDKVTNIARKSVTKSINIGKSKLRSSHFKNVHASHDHVSAKSHAHAPVIYL